MKEVSTEMGKTGKRYTLRKGRPRLVVFIMWDEEAVGDSSRGSEREGMGEGESGERKRERKERRKGGEGEGESEDGGEEGMG